MSDSIIFRTKEKHIIFITNKKFPIVLNILRYLVIFKVKYD